MGSTSKRATTKSVRYTFSEDEEEGESVKNGGKKTKAKTVVCNICNKKYTDRPGLLRHMELHKDTLDHQCDICDSRFKTKQYLVRHQLQVHSPATHECEFCGKKFTMSSKLDQHRLIHTGEKPHKCEVCGKTFRAQYSLKTHRFLHTNEKPFKCQYCSYACRDSSTLRKHHERHTGTVKKYECSYCDKKYFAKSMLRNHVSERHFATEVKVIPCPRCTTKFSSQGKLNHHIRMVHERAFRCSCEVCGAEIASRYNMAAHLRAHVAARPYQCAEKACRVTFKDASSLRKHSVIHKPWEQHSCEVCGKLFSRRHRLKAHVRRHGVQLGDHKVLFCDFCGFGYDNKPCLVRHMLKHIRHKNTYACDICKFVTHRKTSIEKHMLYGHGDEDDVHCKICDRSYKLHAYLITHYYNRHRVRYKTVKSIKLETSVTIKQEPQELIPDVEVNLEDIQKQEPLAGIITDVALDVEATDINYSKSVLSEDIRSSCSGQFAVTPSQFRRRLSGRKAIFDEQNTPYARKEKVMKKQINKLLARVRQKKWTKVLERARREYNERIRAMANKGNKDKENNIKIKYINVNQAYNKKDAQVAKNDTENLHNIKIVEEIWSNEANVVDIDIKDHITNNELDENETRNDCKGDTTSLDSYNEVTDNVRNVYEDLLDIEENPIVNDSNEIPESDVDTENCNEISNLDNFDEIKVGIEAKIDSERENSVENESIVNFDANNGNEASITNERHDSRDLEAENDNNISNLHNHDANENVNKAKIVSEGQNFVVVTNLDNIDENQQRHEVFGVNSKINSENVNRNDASIKSDGKNCFEIENLENTRKISEAVTNNFENEISKNVNESNLIHEGDTFNQENVKEVGNIEINVTNWESNKQSDKNCVKKVVSSNNSQDSIVNCDKGGLSEERGKNVNLKINTHQCYICHKLYETKKKLLEHCQEHFDICTDIPLKKCPLCNYVTKLTITRHIKLVHGINITLPYKLNDKNKNSNDTSRYYYNVNDKIIKEIEIIPSVRNLNKIAYVKIDQNNRKTKDLSVAKTKLVKKSGEWVVEHEKLNVTDEFILPEFDKKEIKKLKHVGDDYLDVIKTLGRLATKHKAKMLYPCNGCEKLCRTFAALKLHSRRHESNPKPFKKKVWKHKLKGDEVKIVKNVNNRKKEATEQVRQAKPKPIENKHKCDKELMDFYEKNVKGADIEFWQFLKIYNRMNKDYDNLKDLKETNEFGDYTTGDNIFNDNVAIEKLNTVPTRNTNTLRVIKKIKPKINKFSRKLMLSKEERLRRAQIKEELRRNISSK